jgi:hypothetical protein
MGHSLSCLLHFQSNKLSFVIPGRERSERARNP